MKKPTLFIVFLTVFIDVVGFSIIFPLFPAMLDYYLEKDGVDSLIGSLVAWLEKFAGDDENAVVTLFGGILGSLYGVLQFVFAPIWGAYSDKHGRRPTLVFTLSGIVFANFIWMFAGSFALLIFGRMLAGIMAGNISTASAVAADITSDKNRASGMIIIGVALGLVVVFGAVLLPELLAQLFRLGLEPLLGHGRVDERAAVCRLVLGRALEIQRRQLPLQRALPLVLNVLDGVLQVFELVQLVTVLLVELQLKLLNDAAQLGRVLFLRALNLRLELVRPFARLGVARVNGRRLERAAGSRDALELLRGGRRGVRVHWWRAGDRRGTVNRQHKRQRISMQNNICSHHQLNAAYEFSRDPEPSPPLRMFATFQPAGDVIHVKLAARPASEADFNAFLADWLACYQRGGNRHASFVFVVDARALAWQR